MIWPFKREGTTAADSYISIRKKRGKPGPVILTWWARPIGEEFFLAIGIRSVREEDGSREFELDHINLPNLRDIRDVQGWTGKFEEAYGRDGACWIRSSTDKYLCTQFRIRFGKISGGQIDVTWDTAHAARFGPDSHDVMEMDVPISARFSADIVTLSSTLKPSLRELLDASDDSALCNGICKRINVWYGSLADVSKQSPQERVVTQVWNSLGIIGNGGFQYLFEGGFYGDPGYVYTAAAFQTLGCKQAAEAVAETGWYSAQG